MSFLKRQKLIGIIILTFIFILIYIAKQAYFWENDFLYRLGILIGIVTLGIAPLWYFWTKTEDRKSNRKQASKTLSLELENTLDGLDRKKYSDDAKSFKLEDNSEIFYMSRKLNVDFYNSLIFSGKINFLSPNFQQDIQDIYNRIKTHNVYLDLVGKMQDDHSDKGIPIKAIKYYMWMDTNEIKIEKSIPIMLKKLEDDFNL